MSRRSQSGKTDPTSFPLTGERGAFIARLHAILRHWPSADRLAKATGVSPSAFRKWLRGEAEPSRERLVALAQAAGVSVGWLASGEGQEPRLLSLAGPPRQPAADAGWIPTTMCCFPGVPRLRRPVRNTPSPPTAVEFIALRHEWVRSVFGIDPDRSADGNGGGRVDAPRHPGWRPAAARCLGQPVPHVRHLRAGGRRRERLVKRVQPKLDGSLAPDQ